MILSIGEILLTLIVAFLVLKPQDIIPIMYKIGYIVKQIKQHYVKIISQIRNWISK